MTPPLEKLSEAEAAPADAYVEGFVQFVTSLPPDQAAQYEQLAEVGRMYGDDVERRVADFEAGRHPLQQSR